jgi:UDP-glucose 4-epimerase
MKRILITGANSYIGTNVERWFMRKPEKYQVDTLDMLDGSWNEKDFSSYDVVFHVAGIAHMNAKKNMEALYYKVNTNLAIETASYAKQCKVKQFIFLSSMSVYGESGSHKHAVITKETKPKPNGFYGISKLQAEIGIKKLEDDQFKVVILRPPMVYGKGCKGNFRTVVKLVKKLPVFPRVNNQRSMIYIKNLCEFVKMLIDEEKSGLYFPQNSEYMNTTEMAGWIAEVLGKKVYMSWILGVVVKILMPFVETTRKAFGNLTYERNLITYESEYTECSLRESIEETLR